MEEPREKIISPSVSLPELNSHRGPRAVEATEAKKELTKEIDDDYRKLNSRILSLTF
jgi:hypothetical protein